MSELRIEGLWAGVDGREILHGIDLTVRSGEVHVVMGPNGSGKSTLSHVLMGRPGYQVTAGSATLDDMDLLALEPWERAHAGLFLALQYPTEVPGVSLEEMLEEALVAQGRDRAVLASAFAHETERLGMDDRLLTRSVNVDMSGGEKKRNETLQLAVLQPKIAVLDELDSGLDIDALRACSRRIEAATKEFDLGVLAITHYTRLLKELKPDVVHILVRGEIRDSGGPELADVLEDSGYAAYGEDAEADGVPTPPATDPFADPFA
jgi:Fe-S cluster assembly ATP-binding protein